jgi:hypothetical protein
VKVTLIIIFWIFTLAYWAAIAALMAGLALDCVPKDVDPNYPYPCPIDGALNIERLKIFSGGLAIYVIVLLLTCFPRPPRRKRRQISN